MSLLCLHDKTQIEAVLRRHLFLHMYALGDLDDFFWPHTTWYGWEEEGEIQEIVLVYTALPAPVILALSPEPSGSMRKLLTALRFLLPRHFYAHLSGDLATVWADDYEIKSDGRHYKMALTEPAKVTAVAPSTPIIHLSMNDRPRLEKFYQTSYLDNAFDPRMLATGHYYAVETEGELVSVGGIHVYSPRYRVAAVGNVTTHPDYRGRGLAKSVCAHLCRALLNTVDHIGLNVKADNQSAIAVYKRLGFTTVAEYEEALFTLK
jgi:RimJ/RimL family protein N-acetyltransferase